MLGRLVVVLSLVLDVAVFQDCSSYSQYSDYSAENISLKGASHIDTNTDHGKIPLSSCDMGLDNATWYRFDGALQQVKAKGDCVPTYHCNTKNTWSLNGSSIARVDGSERQYKMQVLYKYGSLDCMEIGDANIYECDTFLLYNFPQIDKSSSAFGTLAVDCNKPQWEPQAICLEDTVEPLKLSTEQNTTTFQLHPSRASSPPLTLSANATRSPASPLISWKGGNTTITPDREGFINGSIFNMWSEIVVPNDATYRTVEYCVDSTCAVFNLFSVDTTGFYQRNKVLFLKLVLKSDIEATDITWEINSKSYSRSETGIIVDNGALDDGVQIASITMYNIDFVPDVSNVILSLDNGTEIEIPSPTLLDICEINTYFLNGDCEPCPDYTVSPEGSTAETACKPCAENTYFNIDQCTACPKGYHSDEGSAKRSDCLPDICPVDTYFKSGLCQPCPAGCHSEEGSTAISDCKKKAFPLTMVLIVIGTCLALLVILMVAVLVYKNRQGDSKSNVVNVVKYAVS